MRPHYSTEFYPLALGTITVAALGYITLGSKTFIRIEIANRTWHCFAALRLNTDRIECTHMPNFIYHFMIIQFSLKGKLPFFSFGPQVACSQSKGLCIKGTKKTCPLF